MKEDDLGKDSLREQYEDALFKLLMDEFAVEEGKRLIYENDRLKNDKDFSLPSGFEARCEKTIRTVFAARRRKESLQSAKKVLIRAAVIVLVCGVAFATLFSSVSAFREAVYKILVNDEHVSTDIDLQESNVANSSGNPIEVPSGAWLPAWLPEGYKMVSYEKKDIKTSVEFSNDTENRIYYYEIESELVLGVDTENADSTEEISINGYDGLVVLKGATISITWCDNRRNIFVRIKTLNIDKKTAIKIAESVTEY